MSNENTNEPTPDPIQPAPNDGIKPLSDAEKKELAKEEKTIEECFAKAENSLFNIHKKRLYREYGTWQTYVEQRWQKTRDWAYKQLRYYDMKEEIATVDKSIQFTEAESRELERLPDVNARVRVLKQTEAKAKAIGKPRTAVMLKTEIEIEMYKEVIKDKTEIEMTYEEAATLSEWKQETDHCDPHLFDRVLKKTDEKGGVLKENLLKHCMDVRKWPKKDDLIKVARGAELTELVAAMQEMPPVWQKKKELEEKTKAKREELKKLADEKTALTTALPTTQAQPVSTAQQPPQEEDDSASFVAATEQMEANARTFIQAKATELNITLGLDVIIQLLESLGVQWKGLGESHG